MASPTTYTLKPLPPLRAFALAAAVSVLGAVLILVASMNHASTVWVVLAALLLVIGLGLLLVGVLSMRRLRTFVELNDDGYVLRLPNAEARTGRWDDVTKVTMSQSGAHLTLYQGQVQRTHILSPGNLPTPEMESLAADIAKRLDANRGYTHVQPDELPAAPAPDAEPAAEGSHAAPQSDPAQA